jgi:raffinose/stachyose/melibiose transport system permease protein
VITQRTSAGAGRALGAPGARRRPRRQAPGALATVRAVRRSARLTVAVLVILAFVCPIYLTVVNAFKTDAAIAGSPESLPVHPTLRNLSAALTQPGHVLEIGLRNSLIVVVCSVALLIPLGSAFSFWVSRKRSRPRAAIMAAFAVGLMIPPQITVLPIIKILSAIGLDHTYPGLILSNIGGGYLSFAVFVYVGFMRSIPAEIIEAARIDGASGLRIWWTIIMPVVRPATATVGIFLSLWIWNDFLNPLLIIGPITGQTVTVGLYDAVSNQVQPDYGLQFGFMFLAALIPVAGYLLVQKQFRAGLTAGSAR